MAPIRFLGRALTVAAALSVPSLAAAHAETTLCEGDKMEEKEPTADKSGEKRDTQRSDSKSDDKSEPKTGGKDSDQRS